MAQVIAPMNRLRPSISLFGSVIILAFLPLVATSSLDLNNLLIAAAPIVITAIAHTLPIAAGGQGLSAGAMVLLAASIVTALPSRGAIDVFTACGVALLVATLLGAATGYLVGKFRAKSSVVTLSIAAASTALSLDILNRVSIPAASALYEILFGAELFGIALVPPIGMAAACFVAHFALRRLRLDRRLSSDPPPSQIIGSYIVAGMGSATAGIFLGGSMGFMNASLGVPILLQVLAAVALGGILAIGSSKVVLGSLLGAMVVVMTEFMAVHWRMPEFLSTSLDAFWLFAAMVIGGGARRLITEPEQSICPRQGSLAGYLADTVALFGIVLLGWKFAQMDIMTTIIGVVLLAAGQAAVVRLGYVDLSMPAMISLGSVAAVSLAAGQDHLLLVILPGLLLLVIGIGIFHGAAVSKLKRAVIPVTVATAGVMQSASTALLFYFPGSYAPPVLTSLAEHRWAGLIAFPFVALTIMLLPLALMPLRSENSSGSIRVTAAFAYSALCSATFGVLLAGLNGTSHYVLVDVHTFPAIAAAFLAVNLRIPSGTFVGAAAFFAVAIVVMDTLLIAAGSGYFPRIMALAALVITSEIHGARRRSPSAG